MHILDLVESNDYLDTVRDWVRLQPISIPENAMYQPKSWSAPRESLLFTNNSKFLTRKQINELQSWWLMHGSSSIPKWDLVLVATARDGKPSLVLIEAKAHVSEFDRKGKPLEKRKTIEEQKRTNDNHEQIGNAIDEASRALASIHTGISISRDNCYQLSNRIAIAWKLASMGIQTTLVFLGFTGDREITKEGDYFADDYHFQQSFSKYIKSSFPLDLLNREVKCGKASFTLMAKSLPVKRTSRPLNERRILKLRI